MTDPTLSRLYFDANVFIYAIEGSTDIANQLRLLFELLSKKENAAVTSELTLAEVLPKADTRRRRGYLELISFSGIFDLRPVTRDVLMETADYRRFARTNPHAPMPKLPDAIHVVTAIREGCDRMISFDRGLKLPQHMQRVTRLDLSSLIQELS